MVFTFERQIYLDSFRISRVQESRTRKHDFDVAPGLEALENMTAFDTDNGIDILKDVVSLPEATLHYLLRGTIACVAGVRRGRKEER